MTQRHRFGLASVVLTVLGAGVRPPPAIAQPCGPNCTTIVPPGPVSGVWTTAGSPYCVTGDIDIQSLTIGPGVCVLVDGPFELRVNGGILVQGTAQAPVVITAKDPMGRWKGIEFQGALPGSHIAHCTISRSDSSAVRILSGRAPTLESCTIADNTCATVGGGIQANVTQGDLVLIDTAIIGNTAAQHGGGMHAQMAAGTQLQMTACRVHGNTANPNNSTGNYRGGGLFVSGDAQLSECTIENNRCRSRCTSSFACNVEALGGGIYLSLGTLTLATSVFRNNIAQPSNGGDCFFGGTSYARGAGVYAAGGAVTATNCLFECNQTTAGGCTNVREGSAVAVGTGVTQLRFCTLVHGSHTAVARLGGTLDIESSILAFNNPSGTVFGPQYNGNVQFAFSDVHDSTAVAPPGTGNINENPGFLSSAGCCPDSLRLSDAPPFPSPCIDAGVETAEDLCRPPGAGQVRSDMGAYGGPGNCPLREPRCYPDCNFSCTLDVNDYICFQTRFALADPYADCDANGVRNVNDYICFQTMFALGCS